MQEDDLINEAAQICEEDSGHSNPVTPKGSYEIGHQVPTSHHVIELQESDKFSKEPLPSFQQLLESIDTHSPSYSGANKTFDSFDQSPSPTLSLHAASPTKFYQIESAQRFQGLLGYKEPFRNAPQRPFTQTQQPVVQSQGFFSQHEFERENAEGFQTIEPTPNHNQPHIRFDDFKPRATADECLMLSNSWNGSFTGPTALPFQMYPGHPQQQQQVFQRAPFWELQQMKGSGMFGNSGIDENYANFQGKSQ